MQRYLIDREDCFEELESWLMALGGDMEESHEELQATLKETLDKVVHENEVLKLVHAKEMTTVREDNRVLKEEVERLKEEMKGMREELVLLARLVAQKGGTNPHSTFSIPTARVVRPSRTHPRERRSAREDFHRPGEDRRGSRHVLRCFRCRGPHKKKDCPKRAVVLAKGKEPEQSSSPLEPASVESLPCCSLGAMRIIRPSEAPSKDAVDVCGTQVQSKLPRSQPPEEEVGCVSEPTAESPREVVLPKQERPRQPRSRRSRNRCKAERKAKSPSHKDGEGAGTQQKAESNGSHGYERGPGRRGKFRGNFDRGGRSRQLTEWACQLASLVANGLKLLDKKQADRMGKIGQPGIATGSRGKKGGSLPKWSEVRPLLGLGCKPCCRGTLLVAVRFIVTLGDLFAVTFLVSWGDLRDSCVWSCCCVNLLVLSYCREHSVGHWVFGLVAVNLCWEIGGREDPRDIERLTSFVECKCRTGSYGFGEQNKSP
ncbi:hypothetical protein GH714_019173 [Hevea brasiliensis]|uniref:Uncharacterized protein n=1 Tax=Hevea brasiliensis TaxID=3981 RepID=A0A6A6MVQ6_HEVBR|nr:hypothetical protein GH714_019094 [Hevea brasiliensis]KAF2317264.1 hypothetical protein GH714_019173 [Hevea brasiliensis]